MSVEAPVRTRTREARSRDVAPPPARRRRWDAPNLAGAAIGLAAFAGYAAVSIFRHRHFGSTVDLAAQSQTVWGYSQFDVIPNTIVGVPNLLGDHFHPVLITLAPFYWIWNSPEVLLVAQALILAVAGVPIYLWGRERLGSFAGLAFMAAFYLYWGVLAGVEFDFHHIVFAVAAMSWAVYATVTRRNRLLWISVAVAMLSREDVALTAAALGAYIVVVQRRYLLGAVIGVLNIVWFGLLIGVIMPALAGVPYRHWTYQSLGSGPVAALRHIVQHPLDSLELLFVPIAKTRIWIGSFGNWLFLPLLSPLTLVTIPYFLERFWSDQPAVWSFHMQYNMLPAPILAMASIDSLARIRARWRWQPRLPERFVPLTATLVVVTTVVASFAILRPLDDLTKTVDETTASAIQSCLDVIPSSAAVAASQELLPHLASRRVIYGIPAEVGYHVYVNPTALGVEFIAIDLVSGGSPDVAMRAAVRTALDADYGIECTRQLTLVLRRGAPNKELSPVFQVWLAGGCRSTGCLTRI
ncbi:MAG TPA: DUF2079 domain-containing protein [Candidatus Dormibacteraeota bacterium]|nr:DUF2079 domain-containing protein [Candidatus Dormibacteraeota bacterium]